MGCEQPGGRGCPCGNSRRSRLPSPRPIRQVSEPSCGNYSSPFRFVSIPRQTSCPDPRQTHDPVVATDDEKIAECCQGFGADVIMMSKSSQNGTERCNGALQKLEKKYDVVVNIQGDEPLMEPEVIDGIVKALEAAPDAVFRTASHLWNLMMHLIQTE